jgi:hypothetical protein
MAVISPNNTGLSGEYFVAAELYRRGWSVGMTIGNAKSVDLFAEKDNKLIQIQVKSIYKKQNVGWPIMQDKIKKECIYIFVNLNADKMLSRSRGFAIRVFKNLITKVIKPITLNYL